MKIHIAYHVDDDAPNALSAATAIDFLIEGNDPAVLYETAAACLDCVRAKLAEEFLPPDSRNGRNK